MPKHGSIRAQPRSDACLPGAGQTGALQHFFQTQTSLSGFRLVAKAPCDRIDKCADGMCVRMRSGQLRFDAIHQLEHVVLIAAGEGERTDRVVHGGESLVYFSQLLCIHASNCGPAYADAQARHCDWGRITIWSAADCGSATR
jgi:hypothetical protein